jgi:hypothetical protein
VCCRGGFGSAERERRRQEVSCRNRLGGNTGRDERCARRGEIGRQLREPDELGCSKQDRICEAGERGSKATQKINI